MRLPHSDILKETLHNSPKNLICWVFVFIVLFILFRFNIKVVSMAMGQPFKLIIPFILGFSVNLASAHHDIGDPW